MNHEDWLDRIPSYLDGTLPEHDRVRVEAHLAQCEACRDAVDLMRTAHVALVEDRVPLLVGADDSGVVNGAVNGRVPDATRQRGRGSFLFLPGVRELLVAGIAGWIGFALGSPEAEATTTAVDDGLREFVLMLAETPENWPPDVPQNRPGYDRWSVDLVEQGRAAGGRRLSEDDGVFVGPDGTAVPASDRPPSAGNYSGWYVVRASNYEEAVEMARRSPHLNWGGILVRGTYGLNGRPEGPAGR